MRFFLIFIIIYCFLLEEINAQCGLNLTQILWYNNYAELYIEFNSPLNVTPSFGMDQVYTCDSLFIENWKLGDGATCFLRTYSILIIMGTSPTLNTTLDTLTL